MVPGDFFNVYSRVAADPLRISLKMISAPAGTRKRHVHVGNIAIANQWIVLDIGLSIDRAALVAGILTREKHKKTGEVFILLQPLFRSFTLFSFFRCKAFRVSRSRRNRLIDVDTSFIPASIMTGTISSSVCCVSCGCSTWSRNHDSSKVSSWRPECSSL